MPRKEHTPEEIVAKLRQVGVLVPQGQLVAEAVRSISMTPFTYYRWRKEFGGLKSDRVNRLKGCCQTNANSSQFLQVCPISAGVERPPLGAVHLA